MINPDRCPCASYVAIIAGIAGRDVVGWLTSSNSSVMTTETCAEYSAMVYTYDRLPICRIVTIFTGICCRDMICRFTSGSAAIVTTYTGPGDAAMVESYRCP